MTVNGYETKTTFWQDFSIADRFGISAIKDTYNRAFNEWKTNVEYVTELCMVLNWKIWDWYEKNEKNEQIAIVYNDLWEELSMWCEENLTGDDLSYYYQTTD